MPSSFSDKCNLGLSLRVINDQATLVLWQWLLPVGEQFPEAFDWMAHDAPQHIVEILPRVHLARLARLHQT